MAELDKTISVIESWLKQPVLTPPPINELYDALELLKEQEAQSVLSNRVCEAEPFRYVRKGFCPKCHQEMEWLFNRKHCGFCGQEVKWE